MGQPCHRQACPRPSPGERPTARPPRWGDTAPVTGAKGHCRATCSRPTMHDIGSDAARTEASSPQRRGRPNAEQDRTIAAIAVGDQTRRAATDAAGSRRESIHPASGRSSPSTHRDRTVPGPRSQRRVAGDQRQEGRHHHGKPTRRSSVPSSPSSASSQSSAAATAGPRSRPVATPSRDSARPRTSRWPTTPTASSSTAVRPRKPPTILALLKDTWGWPVNQGDLNAKDPLVNTGTEYMYQMATIAHHTLDGSSSVVP